MIIAQGAEAGGHRSALGLGPDDEAPQVGTLALVPQVVDAVSIPVVGAGGIADGRGVVAALALGAQAAQIGTRFLLARESGAFPAWKAALLAAAETDTVVTRAYTGRPARGVRNRLHDVLTAEGPRPLAWPLQRTAAGDIYEAAQSSGDRDLYPLLGGQATRLLRARPGRRRDRDGDRGGSRDPARATVGAGQESEPARAVASCAPRHDFATHPARTVTHPRARRRYAESGWWAGVPRRLTRFRERRAPGLH